MSDAMIRMATLGLAALLVGCEGGNDAGSQASPSLVVESPTPSGATAKWEIENEPRFEVGKLEGSQDQILYRVYSAAYLPDGGVLISNSGSQQLRIYDSKGILLRSLGRTGSGPGEFGDWSVMRILSLSEDSMVVSDEANGRVNVFALDGSSTRSFSPASVPGSGRTRMRGRFDDGTWLSVMPTGGGFAPPGDIIETEWSLYRHSENASSMDEIVTLNGRRRISISMGDGVVTSPFVPLGAAALYRTDGSSLVTNSSGNPELRRYSADDSLEAIYRWSPHRTRIEDIWPEFSEDYLEGVSEDSRPAYRRLLESDDLPLDEFVPAMEDIVIDSQGLIWVAHFRLPWRPDRVWDVLSPDGEWLGPMTTPEGMKVLEIGDDYILGVHADQLGTERVRVFTLHRN
jgi:hypothetical protein